MKRDKYPKVALRVGLKKEDIDLIRAVENYSQLLLDELCNSLGLKRDDLVVKETVNYKND